MANGIRKVKPNGIMLKDSICYVNNCLNLCFGGSWDENNRPLCKLHAARWKRHGDPLKIGNNRGRAIGINEEEWLFQRFMKNLSFGDRCEDGTRHLLYDNPKHGRPGAKLYGRIFYVKDGKFCSILAHRYLYEKWEGPILENHDLDHRPECPKNCVNPAHLTPLTRSEHAQLESKRGVLQNAQKLSVISRMSKKVI